MFRLATVLIGLVAAVTLATGPAAVASGSATPQAFSISVSPGKLAPGEPGSVRQLTLANNGTQPVTLRAELSELSRNATGQCGVGTLGNLTWATVTPASLTLPPGGHQTATVTIGSQVPAGMHDMVAAFVAVPGGGSGVSVSGAVGAQMQVQGNGQATTPPCVALAAPPSADPSAAGATTARTTAAPATPRAFPWLTVALGLAVLALTASTLILLRRRPSKVVDA
jgi:hypothetical protein